MNIILKVILAIYNFFVGDLVILLAHCLMGNLPLSASNPLFLQP